MLYIVLALGLKIGYKSKLSVYESMKKLIAYIGAIIIE